MMTFLFKIEEVFEIAGRGCVIIPVIVDGADLRYVREIAFSFARLKGAR